MALALAFATLTGAVIIGALATSRGLHQPVPTSWGRASLHSRAYAEAVRRTPSPTAPQHGRRLVVAFVVGANGTIVSDLLAPYDILASSSAFATYVVADTATPAPLEGGPALVPTYTFADVDADAALEPDLVVVPGLSDPTGSGEAPLRAWVARQHDGGASILGVCSGALVLAETGMLDGRHATSHWSRIGALERSRPEVHWLRGRQYVEDGSIITTAAVTSGIPASLHLIATLAGTAEARRVAGQHPELDWAPTQSTEIREDHFAVNDWPVGLSFVMPWFRPTVGIALRSGVSELDAAAAFEVYGQSAAAGTVALSDGNAVRTRHGLVLLTTEYADAPDVSRVVVPGASASEAIGSDLRTWAFERRIILEQLGGNPSQDGFRGGGFAAALQNLARHTDAATTLSTAKMIGYPVTGLELGAEHGARRTVLLAISALAFAAIVGLAPAWLVRTWRQGRGGTRGPGGSSMSLGDGQPTPAD